MTVEIIRTLKLVNSRCRDNKSTWTLALVWVSWDGTDNSLVPNFEVNVLLNLI